MTPSSRKGPSGRLLKCGHQIRTVLRLMIPLRKYYAWLRRLALQNFFQSIPQVGMLEPISAGHKLGGFDALAAKKKLFAHLSENQPDGESRHGKNRRAVHDGSQ